MSHQIEVTRVIASSPERVYELISDLPRMGEWSPENTGGTWAKGSTGPAVGAKFKGTNSLGKHTWTTDVTVTKAQPGKEFAFDVKAGGMKVAGWGFSIEPADGGSRVTHYWDDHRNAVVAKITGMALGVPDRASHNKAGMERTLDGIASAI